MNQIDALLRFGYALVIVTILLMIWASLAGARELDTNKHPPCLFSPLCTCSKVSPNDLGIIQCKNVPYPALPRTVNNSKVFMLKMERTGLHYLQPNFLQGTGLYRIEIAHNPLGEVPESAFDGLERSLWELSIHHNQLVEIPSRALRNLRKLKVLDLTGNQIDCIEVDSFSGLDGSLERLSAQNADNSIAGLPRDAFSSLPKLETIDLSGNNIAYLEPSLFQDGMPSLAKLLLGDNVFTEVPYAAISSLRNLRVLELSHNVIGSIRTENGSAVSSRLTLDILHLEFNRIEEIPTASFSNFDVVNVTYLDGNPLQMLGDRAFESVRIRELYIRHCGLSFISPASFEGMGNSLQVLDISGNNLTVMPKEFLKGFTEFRVLNLKDNKFKEMQMNDIFAAIQPTIEKLDLSGRQNAAVSLKSINKFRALRSLSLGTLSTTKLSPEDFQDFGVELEDLKLTRSGLETIKSHAFKYVRGVRRIYLSENQIGQIDNDAFTEIGHSLTSLKISHGFGSAFTAFPMQSFRTLTSLQELDLSNNQLKSISDTSFHFLQNLRTVELNDNAIERISKGFFYCAICGRSFHDNIKELESHYESEHGVSLNKVQRFLLPNTDPPKEPAKKPAMAAKEMKTTLTDTKSAPSSSDVTSDCRSSSSEDNLCTKCQRTFGSRKSLNLHHTLKHGKAKKSTAQNGVSGAKKVKGPVNSFAVSQKQLKLSKNQKSNNKKWNQSTNEAVVKTVIQKVPSSKKKSSNKSKVQQDQPNEPTNKTISCAVLLNDIEKEISQDQTVSSTHLSASHLNVDENDLDIKPEPFEEYSNNYMETSTGSCNNGWANISAQYDDWNYGNDSAYIDTSPRLKVKDLTNMQDQLQPYQTETSPSFAPNSVQYKQQSVIVTNQNQSGFQIQNVQSYQVHPMQTINAPPPAPPLQPQPQLQLQMQQQPQQQQQQQLQIQRNQHYQQHQHQPQQQQILHPHLHQLQPQQHQVLPQQPYVEYTQCMNTINSNMNLNEHGMCSTNNLYEMHITQAPQPVVQSTQLLNPVFLLPNNSAHTVSDYHY